jgi:uncharacterized protein YbcI
VAFRQAKSPASAEPRGPHPHRGELLEAISKLLVSVYADRLGRGPTKVRAELGEGTCTCVMRDTMTTVERSLLEAGHEEKLLEVRNLFRETVTEPLSRGVEELTGRPVLTAIAGARLDPDVVTWVFVFQ